MRNKLALPIILVMIFLTVISSNVPRTSSVASAQKQYDPVCVEGCRQRLFDCYSAFGFEKAGHHCKSEYNKCLAHCPSTR